MITAVPAFAAQALSCTTPASGGTSVTFHAGVTSTESIVCQEETGISGTSAYPTISIATDTLPADGNPTLATGASCTTSTSGSGTTEQYIEHCNFSDTPTAADESGTAYTATFTATPAAFTGSTLTPITSGTLSVTVNAPTVTCIDPASGGSSTTFYMGSANTYTVECEEQSGISGVTAYPSSIVINSGSLPADGNPTFATSTSSSPGLHHRDLGLRRHRAIHSQCALADTPTASDGRSYPFTFTATGAGGVGTTTSGTLTVTIARPLRPRRALRPPRAGPPSHGSTAPPRPRRSSATARASPRLAPAITRLRSPSTRARLPADASEATSLSSSPACTTATSGSGTTEQYQLSARSPRRRFRPTTGPTI